MAAVASAELEVCADRVANRAVAIIAWTRDREVCSDR
jgi:hypothetical protein